MPADRIVESVTILYPVTPAGPCGPGAPAGPGTPCWFQDSAVSWLLHLADAVSMTRSWPPLARQPWMTPELSGILAQATPARPTTSTAAPAAATVSRARSERKGPTTSRDRGR